jgi:hypothetical protein
MRDATSTLSRASTGTRTRTPTPAIRVHEIELRAAPRHASLPFSLRLPQQGSLAHRSRQRSAIGSAVNRKGQTF